MFNINNDSTDVNLRDLTVAETGLPADATAFPGGGAILLAEGRLTVADCTFRDTDVPRTLDYFSTGGAIEASSGTRLVTSASSFTGCSAAVGGAIYSNEGADVTVNDSAFISNDTRFSGAAIAASGQLVIRKSEFIDNYTEGATGGAVRAPHCSAAGRSATPGT